MIRLVVCDLDGTLLKPGASEPPESLVRLFYALHRKGISLCVSSGRCYASLKHILQHFPEQLHYICSDGALTLQQERVRAAFPISDTALKALSEATAQAGCGWIRESVYSSSVYGVPHEQEALLRRQYYGHLRTYAPDPAPLPVFKFAVPFVTPAAADSIKAKLPSDIRISCDRNGWLECSPVQVDKGTALSALCAKSGITAGQTVAFGDSLNDLPMLRFSGKAYRMDNASKDTALSAFPFCTSIEETVARLVPGLF